MGVELKVGEGLVENLYQRASRRPGPDFSPCKEESTIAGVLKFQMSRNSKENNSYTEVPASS